MSEMPGRTSATKQVPSLSDRAGYSLVEVLTVMALASLTLALTSPMLGSALRSTATRVAADEFVATHDLARTAAIRYGRLSELHIDETNGRFWVEVDTAAIGSQKDTIGVVKYLDDPDVTLTSDRSRICFDPRGFNTTRNSCEAGDATVIFSMGEDADTLTFTRLGRVIR